VVQPIFADQAGIGQADKNWAELVRLVRGDGAKSTGSVTISILTDSWEEWNHAF